LAELPSLSAAESDYAWDISGDGTVVVGQSGNTAFRWSLGSNPEKLGEVACHALAVNFDGSVIVGDMKNAADEWRAFRWTAASGLVELGALDGTESHAWSVSDDGSVVIGESGSVEEGQALIWTANDGLRLLSRDLELAGADLSGWELGTAMGVSGNGTVIVGYGLHDAHLEGWVAHLPE
jgi:probable HAF family extracellular repeat protein